MSDEYLWDRSGEPDEELERLERELRPLRFDPEHVVLLPPEPKRIPAAQPSRILIASAVLGAIAAAALLWWFGFWVGRSVDEAPVVHAQVETPATVFAPPPLADPLPRGPGPKLEPKLDPHLEQIDDEKAPIEDRPIDEIPMEEDFVEYQGKLPPPAVGNNAGSKKPPPAATPDPIEAGPNTDLSVDCVLDPSKCKKPAPKSDVPVTCILDPAQCEDQKGAAKQAQEKERPSSLPKTLSSSDIRRGVQPIKGVAKRCGAKHGVAPGTKVQIKFAISGATGRVTNATPQGVFKGTVVGECTAAAFKKAQFPRFRKASIGVVYPIRM